MHHSPSTTTSIARASTIVSIDANTSGDEDKSKLISSYQNEMLEKLQDSFNARTLIQNPLCQLQPTRTGLVAFRALFALLGEDKLVEYHLGRLSWINPFDDAEPSVKALLKDHQKLEGGMRKLILSPQENVSIKKTQKIKEYMESNKAVFQDLEHQKDSQISTGVIWNMVEIVKMTIGLVDKLRLTSDVSKIVSNNLVRIRGQSQWGSYKKLMQKPKRGLTKVEENILSSKFTPLRGLKSNHTETVRKALFQFAQGKSKKTEPKTKTEGMMNGLGLLMGKDGGIKKMDTIVEDTPLYKNFDLRAYHRQDCKVYYATA